MGSVRDGRLRMRRLARYVHIRKFSTEQDDDHIWNKLEKTKCQRPFGPWGVKEPLLLWHKSVLDIHGAQTWN